VVADLNWEKACDATYMQENVPLAQSEYALVAMKIKQSRYLSS